jgi:hypothetical protein
MTPTSKKPDTPGHCLNHPGLWALACVARCLGLSRGDRPAVERAEQMDLIEEAEKDDRL